MNKRKGQVILQMYFGNMLSKCLSFQSIKLQNFISIHYCSDFALYEDILLLLFLLYQWAAPLGEVSAVEKKLFLKSANSVLNWQNKLLLFLLQLNP